MKDIEWVERYILNELSVAESGDFEQRLQNEPPIKELAGDIGSTLHVLQRQWLRSNLRSGFMIGGKALFSFLSGLLITAVVFISYTIKLPEGKRSYSKHYDPRHIPAQGVKAPVPEPVPYECIGQDSPIVIVQSELRKDTGLETICVAESINIPESINIDASKSGQQFLEQLNLHDAGFDYIFRNVHIPMKINHLEGGLIIEIPANSLQFENGEIADSAVFQVKYFSDYYKMWCENVSTTSDGKLLESGGSCFIDAYWGNQKLQLRKDSCIRLYFPAETPNPRMTTFVANRDSMNNLNWELEEQNKSLGRTTFQGSNMESKSSVDADSDLYKQGSFLRQIKIDSQWSYTQYYFEIKTGDNIVFPCSTGIKQGDISKSEVVKEYLQQFDSLPWQTIKYLMEQEKQLSLLYHYDGGFSGFDYIKTGTSKKYRQMDREVQRFARRLGRGPLNAAGAVRCGKGSMAVKLIPKERMVYSKDTLEQIDTLDSGKEKIAKETSNYNFIVSHNFGYINCDYFRSLNNLTTVSIALPNTNTQVMLFFREFNAVTRCTSKRKTATMDNMPLGEKVIIVATYPSESGMKMCLLETTIDKTIELGDFEEFNSNRLELLLTGRDRKQESSILSGTRPW